MSSDNYKHINLEAINDIADGDAEFVREIIGNYLSTISDSIRGLNEAVADDNAERIVFFAHKLKGTFAFIGADSLQNLAMDMEANPTDVAALKIKISELIATTAEAEAELRMVLKGLADRY